MSEVRSYAPGTPAWVDLMTTDPEGAREFYGELFGWSFDIGAEDTQHYTMCQLGGRDAAGIGGEPAPAGMPTAWTMYLASDDVSAAAERITAASGNVMMGPMDVFEHGRLVVAMDPTGAIFGLWQAGEHIGATVVNEPGAVIWNELATRDLASARAFYGEVLGYQWAEEDTGESGPPYFTFEVEGQTVGGAMQMGDEMADVPPHWLNYFAVADVDATVATAERLGGSVRMPPMESPYGRFAILSDPQGGVFSAIQPSGPAEE